MMRNLFACAVVSVALAAPAVAQQPADRFVISVNAGGQTGASAISQQFDFDLNLETATVDVQYPFKTGPLFDGGIAYRVWKRLSAGIAVSRFTHDGPGHVEAKLPHPFGFPGGPFQTRTISGDVSSITRTETAVHLQLLYTVASSRRLRVVVSGGPSRLNIEQELVEDVKYDESYPYDVATFRSATTRVSTGSKAGFNAGADVSWMFTDHFGVGGLLRFTRSTIDLDAPDNRRIRIEAGGAQAGAGLRVVF